MIHNWDRQKLKMDYHNIDCPIGKPSDIDMYYISRNGFLILGEIKNYQGEFTDTQRWLLSRIIDGHKGGGTILYITHDKFVEKQDRKVDVSQCFIEEYYWEGKWYRPKKPTTVNEAFRLLLTGIF